MTRIIKAQHGGADDGPKATVLKLADLAAEARSLVLEARKEAARIVADARGKAEEAERQAGEKGYAEGHARGQEIGYAEGRQKALAETREVLAAESADLIPLARRAVEELIRAKAQFAQEAGRRIVELAAAIAEKVVGRLAHADAGAARANLTKALELSTRNAQWTVLVHPDQLEPLRAGFPELAEALGLSGRVRWVADERITRGGVKVLTARGEIDATTETQLANVVEVLMGAAAPEGEGDEAVGDESYVSESAPAAGQGPAAPPEAEASNSPKVVRPISGSGPSKGHEGV